MNGNNLVDGSPAAKDLGIYLGQLYGWVKSGKLKNYKKDGKYVVEGGKGLVVDIDEARAVWMSSSKKTPKVPGQPRAKRATTRRTASGEREVVAERKARRLPAGTIISYENGKHATSTKLGPPRYTVAQVLAANGRVTFMDDGDHRRHYDATQIDSIVFGTDRLSLMISKGIARIEHPVPILGMVLLAFVMEGKVDLAESLEAWMVKNDVAVIVPELMDVDEDEEEEPLRGKPIMILAEEEGDAAASDDTEE